jgi:pSer/pThr/pTyr-binding forkhead associated (FHA) protein
MDFGNILLTTIISLTAGVISSYFTTKFKLKEERIRWQKELTLKLAELAVDNPQKVKEISKQFATGVLVVLNEGSYRTGEGSIKYFIPPNSRLLIGRDTSCDIIISEATVSRQHLIIQSDDKNVYVESIGASRPIVINGQGIFSNKIRLKSGDKLNFDKTTITFQEI